METLVQKTNKEVGWHGYATKAGSIYYIKDIILYPQEVTSATVTPNEKEYAEWLDEQWTDPAKAVEIRFHGHSHVNMGVTPSGVDTHFRESLTRNLGEEDFYIFIIMNKQGNMSIEIYDTEYRFIFDEKDTEVVVAEPTELAMTQDWVAEETVKYVKEPKPTYTQSYGGNNKCQTKRSTTANQSSSSTQTNSGTVKSMSSVAEPLVEQWQKYYADSVWDD